MLVNFQGARAYEVRLDGGTVYIDANRGQVLYNDAAARRSATRPPPAVIRVAMRMERGMETRRIERAKSYGGRAGGPMAHGAIRRRRQGRQAALTDGVKALLAAASVAGTMGGWALLAWHGQADTVTNAVDQSALVAQAAPGTAGAGSLDQLTFRPLPTLVPELAPGYNTLARLQPRQQAPLATATQEPTSIVAQEPTSIVAQEAPTVSAAPPLASATPAPQRLRSVTVPARRPAPAARTRSSR